jgi:hypothetical protein
LVGVVEVAWKGRIQRTAFPIPLELPYLLEATKTAFLEEVQPPRPQPTQQAV